MKTSARFFTTVLFDWGDTVMRDDPAATAPMVEWGTVHAVDGVADVLHYLHSSARRIVLATSADVSDESQIRAALGRVGLDRYFSHIYCLKNTGLPKGEAMYRHILHDLQLSPAETLMIGDHFEKDVLAANAAGIFAIWLDSDSEEIREGSLYRTVHSMPELLTLFRGSGSKV